MQETMPFGYRLDKEDYIKVHEDEAMLVREIYRLYIKYQSFKKVSDGINNSNLFPENKRKFNPIEIRTMLKNIFYAGHWMYISPVDREEIAIPFHHDGIVPSEIWEEVQKLLTQQEQKGSR